MVCQACGQPGSIENPLQSAHVIGFDLGVIDLGLTPEFLDSDKNIVTAHRQTCNRRSELSLCDSMLRLRELSVNQLPPYLPPAVQEAWAHLVEGEKRQ